MLGACGMYIFLRTSPCVALRTPIRRKQHTGQLGVAGVVIVISLVVWTVFASQIPKGLEK